MEWELRPRIGNNTSKGMPTTTTKEGLKDVKWIV
jgi:hypothetical protein